MVCVVCYKMFSRGAVKNMRSFVLSCHFRHVTGSSFFGIGLCGLPYPGSLFPCLSPCIQALLITGAIAAHHVPELLPIDLAEIIMATFFIPLQIRVWKCHAQQLYLFGY